MFSPTNVYIYVFLRDVLMWEKRGGDAGYSLMLQREMRSCVFSSLRLRYIIAALAVT